MRRNLSNYNLFIEYYMLNYCDLKFHFGFRFCADSSTPTRREKLQVNVNIKDIFAKKKSGLSCS